MNLNSLLCAAALVFAASTAAHADVVNLTYASNVTEVPGPLALSGAHLQVTYDPAALNQWGGYNVTGISGEVDGDPITGLTPTFGPSLPYLPDGLASCNHWCTVDDSYTPGGGVVDYYGLGFQSASTFYNLFNNEDGTYWLLSMPSSTPQVDPFAPGAYDNPPDGVSITAGTLAVPEPGTWSLMIFGAGLLGMTLRRRRASVLAAA